MRPDVSAVTLLGEFAALGARHGYDQRVSVLGYTARMRDLLSGDGFVTTTLAPTRR